MRLGLWFSCLYIFAVFFRPQELYPDVMQVPNLMGVLAGLAVAATLGDILAGARPVVRQPPVWFVAFFVLWAALTVVAVFHWLGGAAMAFEKLSINVFVFFIVALQGSEMSRLAAIRRAALAALLLSVGFGLRAYYLGPRQAEFVYFEGVQNAQADEQGSAISDLTATLTGRGPQPAMEREEGADHAAEDEGGPEAPCSSPGQRVPRLRALGLLNDPNDLAQTLVASIPLVLLAWRPRRPLTNLVFAILPTAAMIWAVVLTRSRGGLVALAALSWFAIALRAGPRWGRALQWSGLAVLFLSLVFFFRSGGADESALNRLEAWSEGLQMLKHSPLWGVGFASFSDMVGLAAHNSFVHCFAELGLVGYFAWLGAILAVFSNLARIDSADDPAEGELDPRPWARSLRLSLTAFLVAALFLSRSYSVSLFFLLGLGTALASVTLRSDDRSPAYSISIPHLLSTTGAVLVISIVAVYAVVILGR
jgi:putative inorganic carbon (HCO3(-)) transporter